MVRYPEQKTFLQNAGLGEANQETLAWRLGVTQPTISKYGSGEIRPGLLRAARLSVLLDVAPEDLARACGYEEARVQWICALYADRWGASRTLDGILPLLHRGAKAVHQSWIRSDPLQAISLAQEYLAQARVARHRFMNHELSEEVVYIEAELWLNSAIAAFVSRRPRDAADEMHEAADHLAHLQFEADGEHGEEIGKWSHFVRAVLEHGLNHDKRAQRLLREAEPSNRHSYWFPMYFRLRAVTAARNGDVQLLRRTVGTIRALIDDASYSLLVLALLHEGLARVALELDELPGSEGDLAIDANLELGMARKCLDRALREKEVGLFPQLRWLRTQLEALQKSGHATDAGLRALGVHGHNIVSYNHYDKYADVFRPFATYLQNSGPGNSHEAITPQLRH
jgi:hypothetical protein